MEFQNEIVATRLDLVEVMGLVAARAADMTDADAAIVELPDGEELVYRAATGAAAPHVGLRLQIAGSLSGRCLREGATLRCDDAEHDDRVDVEKCRAVGARSMLCVPLRHHATVVGVLKVSSGRCSAFDDGHAALLQLLSGVIAAHIANTAEFERLDLETRRSQRQAIAGLRALARAIDAKDPMTRQHSDRVAQLASTIALRLGWPDEQTRLLHEAALLHDVGKIGIPDSILLKPERLDAEEYARVKEHAALGATIVEGVLTPEQAQWIRWHHERPDGRGYPDALASAAIPEGAAIIALADSWDVMTISRPYSPPMNRTAALDECKMLAGRQFKESLVEILTDIV
ncbi:MAG TPA: HD domain-containing phosphohydrolase [Solirubrobacteraceae bacterium]|nr:HD domain-containing phosphohydrolase [Solirubrobacteraceae bacterium]